MRTGAN